LGKGRRGGEVGCQISHDPRGWDDGSVATTMIVVGIREIEN
jgi:hypothetical protein